MMHDATHGAARAELGPWNPGISSDVPDEFLHLSTLYRPENASTSVKEARELADFTGLPAEDLVEFRAERLVLHELLIRVMADVAVPDGAKYEDLGINFREMVRAILNRHVAPHMAEIVAGHEALKARIASIVEAELAATLFAPPAVPKAEPARRGLLGFLTGRSKADVASSPTERQEDRDARLLAAWHERASIERDPATRAAYQGLDRIATAIHRRRGRIMGAKSLLVRLATAQAANLYGSELIGSRLDPLFREAVAREGFRLLPAQAHPVVMNVKGASASGKSTMRPQQKRLAERLGVRWDEFALISPDIWRKYLLDYASLGAASRYAGTLTGHEVAIIDKKLDRYMARKGEEGRISHLLIDRFRFDSFATEPGKEDGSRLLTRFGHIVYMFFMITPPEATVERAYRRGEQFGRYKAVDDLLDHNVEAYNGMPRLFFTWALKTDKEVHFEFLDNSVPHGTVPRTVAFGWNREMNILDLKVMLDVDRYAKLNVNARHPGEVYVSAEAMAAERNTQFLRQCARTMPVVNFADHGTGRIYARLEDGRLAWCDPEALAEALGSPDTRAGLEAVIANLAGAASMERTAPRFLDREGSHTLGAWGAIARPS